MNIAGDNNQNLTKNKIELAHLRDKGAPSSRNSSKGALLNETFKIFNAVRKGLLLANIREIVMGTELFPQSTYETRRTIWRFIHYRFLSLDSEWIGLRLADATAHGLSASEFVSLTYLIFLLRDKLAFDFVTNVIWSKWNRHITVIDQRDFLFFLEEQSVLYPEIKSWREITRKKLASSNLAALRDFGLLRGTNLKYIQRPPIAPVTVYHLVCILLAEGRKGREIIEAQDWRLFLWSEADIVTALTELTQLKWVHFEKSGQTTLIELTNNKPETIS